MDSPAAQALPAVELELQARSAQIAAHLPQVRRIANAIRRRLPRQVALEDLVQAGVLGLMDALQKFDARRHVQFAAYANFRIGGAILDSLRELDWAPREVRRQARRMEQCQRRLNARLGRIPEESELARDMRMSLADFRSRRAEIQRADVASLDAPAPGEKSGDAASQLGGPGPCPYEECRRSEVKRLLVQALAELPQRERLVLSLYYFEELTMKEVGRVLGVDESRVSQIHSAAMARLSAVVRSRFAESALHE
jgi:RNA polymerase sigma factor for flagellar operon FliA